MFVLKKTLHIIVKVFTTIVQLLREYLNVPLVYQYLCCVPFIGIYFWRRNFLTNPLIIDFKVTLVGVTIVFRCRYVILWGQYFGTLFYDFIDIKLFCTSLKTLESQNLKTSKIKQSISRSQSLWSNCFKVDLPPSLKISDWLAGPAVNTSWLCNNNHAFCDLRFTNVLDCSTGK